MSGPQRRGVSRRGLAAGLLGVAAAGAGLWYAWPELWPKRYPPTPYDDLLSQLSDRDSATKLGLAAIAEHPQPDTPETAAVLRRRLGGSSLKTAIHRDLAEGRIEDARGWLLPQSLVAAARIAASPK